MTDDEPRTIRLSDRTTEDDLQPIPGRTYTSEQLAAMHHTAPSTVRHWRRAGTGPDYFMAGKRVLYRGEDILAWRAAGGTR